MTEPCPICGAPTSIEVVMPLDSKSLQPTRHGAIARCTACSLAHLSPRPSPAETAGFYRLDQYYTHGRDHMSEGEPDRLLDRVRCHLAWRADRSTEIDDVIATHFAGRQVNICDVGCGGGSLAQRLVQRGHRVTGVERDRNAVSFAGDNFQVVEGSIESLASDVAGQDFDAVVMSHVLEHIVDPMQALAQIHRVLAPGRLFICQVPNNASATALQSGLSWEHLDVPRHVAFWDAATLRAAMGRAGFRVVQTFYNGYCRFFSNSYIATEQRIFDGLHRHLGQRPPRTRRNGRWPAWQLLVRTLFAGPDRKYDTVGVVASRSP